MPNLPHLVGLEIPNVLPANPEFVRPAGRLIWSTLLMLVMTAAVVLWARRGPYLRRSFARSPRLRRAFPGLEDDGPAETTWAGAMLGAVYVFALMIVAYGVVPHEWMNYANSHLNWGTDRFLVQDQPLLPFDVTLRAVKDTVATLIYVVIVSANIYLFSLWQKRVRTVPEPVTDPDDRVEAGTSAYGRPVTAKG